MTWAKACREVQRYFGNTGLKPTPQDMPAVYLWLNSHGMRWYEFVDRAIDMGQQYQPPEKVECPECEGKGQYLLLNFWHPCPTCKGAKVISKDSA